MKRKAWLVFAATVALTFTVFLYGNVIVKNKDFLDGALMDKTNRTYLMDQEVKGLSDKGFNTGGRVFFLVKGTDQGKLSLSDLTYIKSYTEKLKNKFPGYGVESIATACDLNENNVEPYLDKVLKTGNLEKWQSRIKEDPGVYGSLIGRNFNYAIVLMSLPPGADDMTVFRQVKQYLQIANIGFFSWYLQPDIHPAGEFNRVIPFGWVIARGGTLHYGFFLDAFTYTPLGIILATFAFYFFYRSFGQTVISVLTLKIAMWWTRGSVGLIQVMGFGLYERFYFLLVLPITLICGVSFVSRKFIRYNELRREFPDEPCWQIWKKTTDITELIITVALLSIINFIMLYQIRIFGILEVGIFSAVSMVILVLLVLLFVPACQILFGGEAKIQPENSGWWERLTGKIAEACYRSVTANGCGRKAIIRASIGFGLVFAGAVFFVASDFSGLTGDFKYIEVNTRFLEYLKGTKDYEAAKFLNQPGNVGFDQLEFYISRKSPSPLPAIEDPEFLESSALLIKKVKERVKDAREIKSVLDTIGVISKKSYGSDLPKNRQQARDAFMLAESVNDPITKEQRWHDDGLAFSISLAADETKLLRDVKNQTLKIAEEFKELKVSAFGDLNIYTEEYWYIITGKPLNVLTGQWLVILIYAGFIGWRNRRLTHEKFRLFAWRTGLTMSIPFAYGTPCIIIAMALLRIPLDQAMACISALAISIAADFCLYPVDDYAKAIEQGKSKGEALHIAIAEKGKYVTSDILLSCLIFIPLCFSRFQPVARLGKIMIVMLILCGLGALVIMPVFLEFCVRKPKTE